MQPPKIPNTGSGDGLTDADRTTLAEISAAFSRRAENLETSERLAPLSDALREAMRRIEMQRRQPVRPTAQDIDDAKAIEEIRRLRNAEQRRCEHWEALKNDIGERYVGASIEGFRLSHDSEVAARQKAMLDRVVAFMGHMDSARNVVLFGPPGSGKDHIMSAMLRRACQCGHFPEWLSGVELFSGMRDSIDSGESEMKMLRAWTTPSVLAISDPLPPFGNLTQFQMTTLFQILDFRYRHCKGTWVTLNVAKGTEADERMGKQLTDRLKHGAMVIFFDWPSYRKATE